MRKLICLAAVFIVSVFFIGLAKVNTVDAQADVFPDVFNIEDGWQPEGIAVGRGTSFYVGSLLHGGVYGGDLRTGEGEIIVEPQAGRAAVGIAVDTRSNAIFVAGAGAFLGTPPSAYVYDAETGEELAEYELNGVLINDVVITSDAAYFTDSGQPVLYRIPLGPGGELPDPDEASSVQPIPLMGPGFDPNVFPNANGIEATSDGKWLIVANTGLESLYRVDPLTGESIEIDLGGDTLPSADGLVLAGKTLYVAQPSLNQVGVVTLNPSLTAGVVSDPLTSPDFQVPTTAAKFGNTIYAVNARFGDFVFGEPSPDLEFRVVGLPRKK